MTNRDLATNNTDGKTNTKEYIILHHTATGYNTIKGVLNTLTKGDVSCHYVVNTNGDIYKINTDDDILWHAGKSSWNGKVGMNKYSIGIEIIGPLPGFTNEQRASVRKLVSDLVAKYNIPISNILRHKDVSPGRKVDVDDSFWNNEYKTFADYKESYEKVKYNEVDKINALSKVKQSNSIARNYIDSAKQYVGEETKQLFKELQEHLNEVSTYLRSKGY